MSINYRHPNRPTVVVTQRDRVSLVKSYADGAYRTDRDRSWAGAPVARDAHLDWLAQEGRYLATRDRYAIARRHRALAPLTVVGGYVRPLAALAAVLAIFLSLGLGAAPQGAQAAPVCQEGESCWEWPTMGGGSRGVILKSAPADCRWSDGWSERCSTVVDASEYCRLRRAGKVDRRRTPSLKGDGLARRLGCDPAYFPQDA